MDYFPGQSGTAKDGVNRHGNYTNIPVELLRCTERVEAGSRGRKTVCTAVAPCVLRQPREAAQHSNQTRDYVVPGVSARKSVPRSSNHDSASPPMDYRSLRVTVSNGYGCALNMHASNSTRRGVADEIWIRFCSFCSLFLFFFILPRIGKN